MAMTNNKIEEIYNLTDAAFEGGQNSSESTSCP